MRIISGECRGRVLHTVTGKGYRPAMGKTREALFSILESRGVIWASVRFLDLFAGSGSLGFEALSRGAIHADFIENSHPAIMCLKKNAVALSFDSKCSILEKDVLSFTSRSPQIPYDVICVDPPYHADLFKPTLRNILKYNWLKEDGFLIAEVEKELPINPESQINLSFETERNYGETRILIWTKSK